MLQICDFNCQKSTGVFFIDVFNSEFPKTAIWYGLWHFHVNGETCIEIH